MTKGLAYQEDIEILGLQNRWKKKAEKIEGKIDISHNIGGDFNTVSQKLIENLDRKISNDTEELKTPSTRKPNQHLRSTVPQNSRIYIIFKDPWNIYQDKPYPEP